MVLINYRSEGLKVPMLVWEMRLGECMVDTRGANWIAVCPMLFPSFSGTPEVMQPTQGRTRREAVGNMVRSLRARLCSVGWPTRVMNVNDALMPSLDEIELTEVEFP